MSSRRPVSLEELQRRTQASRPAWERYHEDVKAQVGAGPVAEWEGEPVEAVVAGHELRIAFALRGAWAGREAAIPVLIRDPAGRQFQSSDAQIEGERVLYRFLLPYDSDPFTLSWIEVRYPKGERRMIPKLTD